MEGLTLPRVEPLALGGHVVEPLRPAGEQHRHHHHQQQRHDVLHGREVPDGRREPELAVGGLLVDHVCAFVAQPDRQDSILVGEEQQMRMNND